MYISFRIAIPGVPSRRLSFSVIRSRYYCSRRHTPRPSGSSIHPSSTRVCRGGGTSEAKSDPAVTYWFCFDRAREEGDSARGAISKKRDCSDERRHRPDIVQSTSTKQEEEEARRRRRRRQQEEARTPPRKPHNYLHPSPKKICGRSLPSNFIILLRIPQPSSSSFCRSPEK